VRTFLAISALPSLSIALSAL